MAWLYKTVQCAKVPCKKIQKAASIWLVSANTNFAGYASKCGRIIQASINVVNYQENSIYKNYKNNGKKGWKMNQFIAKGTKKPNQQFKECKILSKKDQISHKHQSNISKRSYLWWAF